MSERLIIIISISVLTGLAILFYLIYRSLQKNRFIYTEVSEDEITELGKLSSGAEEKEAVIVSVRPEDNTRHDLGSRIVRFRFAIKIHDEKFESFRAKWKISNYYSENYLQGKKIKVKVYQNLIFPATADAALLPESKTADEE